MQRRPPPTESTRGRADQNETPGSEMLHADATAPGARRARAPWRLTWRAWRSVLQRTYNDTMNDRLFYVAAGVAFFVLLSIFPAISALVSSYALIADPTTIEDQIALLKGIVPPGTYTILNEQVRHLIDSGSGTLGFTFLLSLAFALWSANSGVKAIIDALNVAYNVVDQRSFIWLTAISLAMTLGCIVVLIVAALAFVVFPLAMSFVGFGGLTSTGTAILRWPLLFLLVLGTIVFLYRHGPDRRPAPLPWILMGAVAATGAWLATSALLSWYLSNIGDYTATYGSLAAAVSMMMWLWLSFVVVLIGAELNAKLEEQASQEFD
jgi:membrane protein